MKTSSKIAIAVAAVGAWLLAKKKKSVSGIGGANDHLLPTVSEYSRYLDIAQNKFGISREQARKRYGQYTIGQWKKLLGIGGAKRTRRIGAVEMTHPSVYVGTYKKYNNGSLFGEWVDLTKFETYDDFMRYIRKLHKDERDPEFMIQDFEGYPESWYYESGMSEDTFNKIKEYWSAFDGDDVKRQAYEAFAENWGDGATIEEFENRYYGTWDDEYDYVDDMIESGVIDPVQWAKKEGTWIYDHDAIWRYLDTGGDVQAYSTDYGLAIINPHG